MIRFQCNSRVEGWCGFYCGFISIIVFSMLNSIPSPYQLIFIVEIIASWDEELGLKAILEIFGLWVTVAVENVQYFGGKSARSQAKLSSKPLAIVVPVVCVSVFAVNSLLR